MQIKQTVNTSFCENNLPMPTSQQFKGPYKCSKYVGAVLSHGSVVILAPLWLWIKMNRRLELSTAIEISVYFKKISLQNPSNFYLRKKHRNHPWVNNEVFRTTAHSLSRLGPYL